MNQLRPGNGFSLEGAAVAESPSCAIDMQPNCPGWTSAKRNIIAISSFLWNSRRGDPLINDGYKFRIYPYCIGCSPRQSLFTRQLYIRPDRLKRHGSRHFRASDLSC